MWFVKSQSKEFAHKQKAKCLWNSFPAKWSRIIILEKYHYWRINANLLRFRIEPLVFSLKDRRKAGYVSSIDICCFGAGRLNYDLAWGRIETSGAIQLTLSNLGLGRNYQTRAVLFSCMFVGFVKLWHCSRLPDCWAIWAVDKGSPFMECVGSIWALPK